MLSDKKIKQEIETGRIVIDPFDERQLGTNSYDVRLGQWYFRPDAKWDGKTVDMSRQMDSRNFWGPPKQSDGKIILPALNIILAHTIEIIGGTNGITTKMHARSSTVRSGLSICRCGGLGDSGYINKWTMEIANHTRSDIVLWVGQRIGQIEFIDIGETDKLYSGKYNPDEWSPYSMLPRLYDDYENG